MRTRRLIFIGFVSLSCLVPAIGQQAGRSLQGIVVLQEWMQKGAYDQVARAAEAAISNVDNQDSLAAFLLLAGQALLELDSLERAKTRFMELSTRLKSQPFPDPGQRAGALSGMGEFYLRTGSFSAALEYFRQSVRVREEAFGKLSEETAAGYNGLGYAYLLAGDKESALKFLTLSLDIRQALLPEDHPDLAGSFFNLGACMLEREKFEEAVWYYTKALELRSGLLGEAHIKTAQAHQSLALAYFTVGDCRQALKGLQSALEIWVQQLGPRHPSLAVVYEQIGDVLLEQYASREAERNFGKAADFYPERTHARALLGVKIGRCMQARGEDRAALGYYLPALEILEKTKNTPAALLAPLQRDIGDAYLKLGAALEALPFLQRAAVGFQRLSPGMPKELLRCLNMSAACQLRLNRPESALLLAKQAEVLLETTGAFTVMGKAQVLKIKAQADFALGRYDAALNLTRNALGLLWPDRNVNKVNRVIAPEIVALLILEARLMPRTGSRYADSAGLLETALQLYRRLNLGFSEEARWEWASVTHALYGEAVEANFQAWKFSGTASFLTRALELSEEHKQVQLEESVRLARATRFRGISTRLLDELQSLETRLFQLEKQRWSAALQERGILESRLAQEIASLRGKLDEVRKDLSTNSPDYTRLFESRYKISIDEIRSLLASDQALLEFFVAETHVFLFVVSRDTFYGFRMAKSPALEASVMDFLLMNSSYTTFKTRYPESFAKDWARLAHRLYQQLLGPAVEQISLPDRLMIVPDGILLHLPFEALLSKLPDNPDNFKDHAYLLRSYSMSYTFSLHVLRETRTIASRGRFWGKYLLSMAPVFSGTAAGGLPEMPYNIAESAGLTKLFGGRSLTGREATLSNFLNLAPQFRVLHLPTHGKAATNGEEYSYLAFAGRGEKKANEMLYAGDLFNLRLRADLVVLSGYAAPVGDYRKGEGVLGFGYGLVFAGSKSIIGALWSPNHARSPVLMTRCFFYLRKGLPKDIALQRAKKDYLEQNPGTVGHPFYWAGLLMNGDPASLPDPRLKWLLSWLIALLGLGLTLFLYVRWVRPKK